MSGTAMRAYHALDPRRALGRLSVAALAGICVAWALPAAYGFRFRAVAGWDTGALVMLALAMSTIYGSDEACTARRAAPVDPGRTAVWILVLGASLFSLFAAVDAMRDAHLAVVPHRGLHLGLCLGAVIASWLLTHVAWTLRYAHLYYREDEEGVGGVDFPGGARPTYVDFAYFAFTVGMCFQVSDVTVSSPLIRRAVLAHALLSFAYNTTIVALALNLVSNLLSG